MQNEGNNVLCEAEAGGSIATGITAATGLPCLVIVATSPLTAASSISQKLLRASPIDQRVILGPQSVCLQRKSAAHLL